MEELKRFINSLVDGIRIVSVNPCTANNTRGYKIETILEIGGLVQIHYVGF